MLTKKQIKCLELMVSGNLSQREISEQIKVSQQSICNWKKQAEFNAEYESLLKASFKSIAAKAFQTEVNLLSARSEMVRLMTAKDILDRAGFKTDESINLRADIGVNIIDDV